MYNRKDKKSITTIEDLVEGDYIISFHIYIDKDSLSRISDDLQNTISSHNNFKYGLTRNLYKIINANTDDLFNPVELIVVNTMDILTIYYKIKSDKNTVPEPLCLNNDKSAEIIKNWAELLENNKLNEFAEIFLEEEEI